MLLAIDAATRNIGIALYDGVSIPYEKIWSSKNFHTVELGQAVQEALSLVNISKESLKCIAIANGPGSFTGLRIGTSLAKGLALSLQIPLIGIDTLEITAYSQPINSNYQLVSILKAGRARVAVGKFEVVGENWQSSSAYELLTPAELINKFEEPTLICGELSEEIRLFLSKKENITLASPANSVRRPTHLAELAWKVWKSGEYPSAAEIAPRYLQTDVNIPQ
jgi:tRNA threonylcarbamoyladenosine biosynthesis protein TsaB